jgi:hypothetical protein
MPAELKAFDDQVSEFVGTYLSFEYITACIYYTGAARAFNARLGLSMEPPPSTPDDQVDAYWELLMETFFPLFEAVEVGAIEQYQAVVRLAQQQRRHSVWVDKAQAGLNDLRPGDYAAVKAPLSGVVDVSQPARLTPVATAELLPQPAPTEEVE